MQLINVYPYYDLKNPPLGQLNNRPYMCINIITDYNGEVTAKLFKYDVNNITYAPIMDIENLSILNQNEKYLFVNSSLTYELINFRVEQHNNEQNIILKLKEISQMNNNFIRISEPSTSSHTINQVSTSFDTSSKHSDVIISQPKKDYNCSALVTCAYNPSDYKNKQNLDFDDSPLKID